MVAAIDCDPGLRRVRYSWKPGRVVPSAKRNAVAGFDPSTVDPPVMSPLRPGRVAAKYIGRSTTTGAVASTPTLTSTPAPTARLTSTVVRPGGKVRWSARRLRLPVAASTMSQVRVALSSPVDGLRTVTYSWKPSRVVPSAKENSVPVPVAPAATDPP